MSVSGSTANINNVGTFTCSGACSAGSFSSSGFSVATNGNLTCDRFVCEGREIERIGTSFYGQDYVHNWGSGSSRWQVRGKIVGGANVAMDYRFSTNSSGNAGAFLATNGNTWSTFSDETMKKDLLPLEADCCSIINNIDTKYFKYIGDETDPYFTQERVGVIAQTCPSHVVHADPDTGKLMVRYTELIPYLIKSNQELQAALTVERARIDTLESDNATLSSRIDALEAYHA